MTRQWLLLYSPTNDTGFAVELVAAPLREGGRPRPFAVGPEGKRFDITLQTNEQGEAYRHLQQSADIGGQQAYALLYAEAYIRLEATARFRLQADGLSGVDLGNVAGHSADLLFALAVIMVAMPQAEGYPPLAATGVLNEDGRIQAVEGVPAKIRAALAVLPAGGKVFYPLTNAPEIDAALRELALAKHIELIPVERLDEVVSEHLGIKVEKAWFGAPYRRLESFTEQHRRIFFGREADNLALEEKLTKRAHQGRPGILILGASGRGKSSLVQAGLIPYLKQTLIDRTLSYDIWRPGAAENLDEAALAALIRQRWACLPNLTALATAVKTPSSITRPETSLNIPPLQQLAQDLTDRLPANTLFLWVLNQMEELFTQRIPATTLTAFCEFLHTLQTRGVWVIGILRSEYYHAYTQQQHLLDMFDDGGIYNLRELNATALERVIRGPAELSGLRFETDPGTNHNLALQLRDDALAGGSDALPLLEFTLDQLYEKRDTENGLLTFTAYQAIGGLEGAIGNNADRVMASFTPEEKKALPEVLSRLVRLSDDGIEARRQCARRQRFTSNSIHDSLVAKLINGRLLISSSDIQSKETVVELVHDCLLKVWGEVQRAIDIHRYLLEEKRKLTNAAKHWEDEGRPKRLLISKAKEVMEAEVLAACIDNDIDPRTQTFLQESIKLTRTGFWLLWLLLAVIMFSGLILGLQVAINGKPLSILMFTAMFTLPPLFLLFRSFRPRPFLATVHVDLRLPYIYICPLIIYAIVILGEPTSLPTYLTFGLLIVYLSAIIPPFLVVRSIVRKRWALNALSRKRIEKKRVNWFSRMIDLFPTSVWTWRKSEVAILVVIGLLFYGTFGLQLENGWKKSASELVTLLQSLTERNIEQGQLDNAKKNLRLARETMGQFMDARSPSSDWFEAAPRWHEDEAVAIELVPLLVNSCRLLILIKEFDDSLKECALAAEISRYWLTNKKSVKAAG